MDVWGSPGAMAGGQQITLSPVLQALPCPHLCPGVVPAWACLQERCCPSVEDLRGKLALPVLEGAHQRLEARESLSLRRSPKPQPLRFPRVLIVSCAPCQARKDRK